jgi:putative salt-induced outer membrane protein YdiY
MKCMMLIVVAALALSAGADTVTLTTGETLSGSLVSQNDAQVVVQHPVLGKLTIPRASVASVVVQAKPDPTPPTEAVAPQPEPTPEPVVEEEGFFAGWSSKLEIGFNIRTGNTESTDGRVRFGSSKENDHHRWKADAAYYIAFDDGDKTDHEATAGLLKDWLFPGSKWFWWAKGRGDYDEFQSWDYRLTGGGGLGYHLVEEEKLTIDLRAGMGLAREFGSDDEDIHPEAQLGIEGEWQIDDRQSIVADTWVYPDVGDLGEYRITSSAAWQFKVDMKRGLSFKLGLENEYESEVEYGDDHNDLKVFGAMVLEF